MIAARCFSNHAWWTPGASATAGVLALLVEVYRPRLSGPVPQAEDVVAVATRKLKDIDVTDERSLAAAVRDAVAAAQPVPRNAR